jgi:hypothetical protein
MATVAYGCLARFGIQIHISDISKELDLKFELGSGIIDKIKAMDRLWT